VKLLNQCRDAGVQSLKKTLLVIMVLAWVATADGQSIIAQHSAANNPTMEGFTLLEPGTTAAVTNDQGYNAWSTGPLSPLYNYSFSQKQQAGIQNSNWVLSVTLRDVGANSGALAAAVYTGTEMFDMVFGALSDGDPFVGPNGELYYALTNAGSTYNNYQLSYNAAANTASFYVNGEEIFSGVSGLPAPESAALQWGGSGQPGGQANWNLVSLEFTPEPPPWGLAMLALGMGMGVRFYRLRYSPARRPHSAAASAERIICSSNNSDHIAAP
jgi:hypothetical protein